MSKVSRMLPFSAANIPCWNCVYGKDTQTVVSLTFGGPYRCDWPNRHFEKRVSLCSVETAEIAGSTAQ